MRISVGVVVKPQTPGFVVVETQNLNGPEDSQETHEVPVKGPQWFLMVLVLLCSEDHTSDKREADGLSLELLSGDGRVGQFQTNFALSDHVSHTSDLKVPAMNGGIASGRYFSDVTAGTLTEKQRGEAHNYARAHREPAWCY